MKKLVFTIDATYPDECDINNGDSAYVLENRIESAIAEGLLEIDGHAPITSFTWAEAEDSQGDTPDCQRCGSPLSKTLDRLTFTPRCTDETCPFSDCDQTDPRGWRGHPEKDPNPKDDTA